MKKKNIDYTNWSQDELIKELKRIKEITYGLVWHRDVPQEKIDILINPDARTPEEMFANEVAGKPFPVLKEVKGKEVVSNKEDQTHILIEGDNYHSLAVLNFTHQEAIDVIYIDPPYNTGKNDFVYTDKFKSDYVVKEDPFRHSKWLSFMEKRLNLAHKLLVQSGVIIIHIDENEENALYFLLSEIFGEENDLGKIIWNKQNPKGDSRGVSIMHESILCFAKNKEEFLKLDNVLQRKKPNAEEMLRKAKALFKKIGKTVIPDEIKEVIKPFDYKKEILEDFKITYNLELVNKEFQNWLSRQPFSGGEKAYKYIDEKGKVYRGVSMAAPDKPETRSHRPLKHPVTMNNCPVPSKGWRYTDLSMDKLLKLDRIIFGNDESSQPQRKYLLEENMAENTPSFFSNALNDDDLLLNMEVKFDHPKPYIVSKYLINSIHPSPKIILDFMAGSGTTGHAVLDLNKEDGGNRKFILCTNNENKIATDTCQPRLEKVINGYKNNKGEKVEGLGGNLKYYTAYDFVESEPSDKNKHKLVNKCTEMLCIKEGIYDPVAETDDYKILKSHDDRYLGIIFYEDAIDEYKKAIKKIDGQINTYVFTLGDDPHTAQFADVSDKVVLQAIPEIILKVYQEIFR